MTTKLPRYKEHVQTEGASIRYYGSPGIMKIRKPRSLNLYKLSHSAMCIEFETWATNETTALMEAVRLFKGGRKGTIEVRDDTGNLLATKKIGYSKHKGKS